MRMLVSQGARAMALVVLVGAVAGCGLPRSGPNKSEIFAGSVLREGDAFVVAAYLTDKPKSGAPLWPTS